MAEPMNKPGVSVTTALCGVEAGGLLRLPGWSRFSERPCLLENDGAGRLTYPLPFIHVPCTCSHIHNHICAHTK